MNISGVTGYGSNVQPGPLGAGQQPDALSKSIQNQITNAREQLQKLSENQDMTQEAKRKRRQEIQQEITGLQQQLRQHQMDQKKEQSSQGSSMEDMLGGSPRTAPRPGRQGTGMSQAGMEAMISADVSMKQARAQGSVATRMEGQAGILRSEIHQDKARGINVEKKEAELSELEQRTQELNGEQLSTLARADQELKETARAEREGGETEETEKAGQSEKIASPSPRPEGYRPVDIRL